MIVGQSIQTLSSQSDADHLRGCPAEQASCSIKALPRRTRASSAASSMHLAISSTEPLPSTADMLDEFWSPQSPDAFNAAIARSTYVRRTSRDHSVALETSLGYVVMLVFPTHWLRLSQEVNDLLCRQNSTKR